MVRAPRAMRPKCGIMAGGGRGPLCGDEDGFASADLLGDVSVTDEKRVLVGVHRTRETREPATLRRFRACTRRAPISDHFEHQSDG